MTTNRQRGWRGIGIMLSVIWFIGFGGYVWVREGNEKAKFFWGQSMICNSILSTRNESLQSIANEETREKREAENWANFKECRDEALRFYGSSLEDSRKGIPVLLALDAGTVAFGWLVAWIVLSVARWVQRGFASA